MDCDQSNEKNKNNGNMDLFYIVFFHFISQIKILHLIRLIQQKQLALNKKKSFFELSEYPLVSKTQLVLIHLSSIR